MGGAGEAVRKASGTMGRRTERPDPNDYLKGQTKCKKVSSRVDVQKFDRPIGTRKEPVPRPHERPVLGLHTAKNFVTANAVEAILQVPAVRYSEQPDYMAKQDYGKASIPLASERRDQERKRDDRPVRPGADGLGGPRRRGSWGRDGSGRTSTDYSSAQKEVGPHEPPVPALR